MKKNMGSADRIIRLMVAIAIVIFYLKDIITGTAGIILLVLAGVFVITGLFGSCPLYTLFGVNTCGVKKAKV